MKGYISMIIFTVLLPGCAGGKVDYFTVNCGSKTVLPPSGAYEKIDLKTVKSNVNKICSGHVGLIPVNVIKPN